MLVVALGADYDLDATPGLVEHGNEFYSVAGAERLREVLPSFTSGTRDRRRLRRAVQVPAGAQRGGHPARRVPAGARPTRRRPHPGGDPLRGARAALARDLGGDPRAFRRARDRVHARAHGSSPWIRGRAVLDDGTRLPCDLFLGIPVHRAPPWSRQSGMTDDGLDPRRAEDAATRFPNVYAVGDVTSVGTAKAGVFAEGAARVVADQLIARLRGEPEPPGYDGTGPATSSSATAGRPRRRGLLLDPGHPTGTFARPRRRRPRRRRTSRPAGGSLVRRLIPTDYGCVWGGSPTTNRGAPPSA